MTRLLARRGLCPTERLRFALGLAGLLAVFYGFRLAAWVLASL